MVAIRFTIGVTFTHFNAGQMKILKYFSIVLSLTLANTFVSAQYQPPQNSAVIYRNIQKLNQLGTVLYIAAHPDDENTRLLAFLAKEKQVRTAYLSLTRGDGGQNLIGEEQGVELGLIRTQELLAARRIDGAEQFFTRAYDFGFSKTPDETLKKWDKQKVLADVVWVIRQIQPDVIITRFPEDARAGHGHHSASAILAREAYFAAADPKAFPEQFSRGVQPWQAKRILWNTFSFSGNNNTTAPDQFKVEVGTFNPLLGMGYGEIASESRSQHKSQGFGVARQRGQTLEYFVPIAGEAPIVDLFDGVNTTWNQLEGGVAIQNAINQILYKYAFQQPSSSIQELVELYKKISALPSAKAGNKHVLRKLDELQSIIEQAAGLFTEVTTNVQEVTQLDTLQMQVYLNARNADAVHWKKFRYYGKDTVLNKSVVKNESNQLRLKIPVQLNFESSQPYWLIDQKEEGQFVVNNPYLIGQPENASIYNVHFDVEIAGQVFQIKRSVFYKFTDPVKGELYQPLIIKPLLQVALAPNVALLNVQRNGQKQTPPKLKILLEPAVNMKDAEISILLRNKELLPIAENKSVQFEAGKPYYYEVSLEKIFNDQSLPYGKVAVQLKWGGKTYMFDSYMRSINYDHIPAIRYFVEDHVKVIKEPILVAGKKVGYIVGAGDKVPQALESMGYDVKKLVESDITDEQLKDLDAIVTGVRAYNVHEFLNRKYDVLMRYVQNGGNLIIQYNTSNQIGPVRAKMAPYDFLISRTRVTEEDANVKILNPAHPVFNYPNKISSKDFEEWIQERSIYQAERFAPPFEALIEMQDKGESPSRGSLLIAPFGKGNIVYTGLVFFRQLPAGVSGAYRLFANLIALPKNEMK